jgi:hypothetical protein
MGAVSRKETVTSDGALIAEELKESSYDRTLPPLHPSTKKWKQVKKQPSLFKALKRVSGRVIPSKRRQSSENVGGVSSTSKPKEPRQVAKSKKALGAGSKTKAANRQADIGTNPGDLSIAPMEEEVCAAIEEASQEMSVEEFRKSASYDSTDHTYDEEVVKKGVQEAAELTTEGRDCKSQVAEAPKEANSGSDDQVPLEPSRTPIKSDGVSIEIGEDGLEAVDQVEKEIPGKTPGAKLLSNVLRAKTDEVEQSLGSDQGKHGKPAEDDAMLKKAAFKAALKEASKKAATMPPNTSPRRLPSAPVDTLMPTASSEGNIDTFETGTKEQLSTKSGDETDAVVEKNVAARKSIFKSFVKQKIGSPGNVKVSPE